MRTCCSVLFRVRFAMYSTCTIEATHDYIPTPASVPYHDHINSRPSRPIGNIRESWCS